MALGINSSNDSGPVSRRTIIKGAAWSAPVMIAAVAVPAAVASSPVNKITPVSASFSGGALTDVSFTLSPTPAIDGVITLSIASGEFEFSNGTKSSAAIVIAGGVITVGIRPRAAGSGTLNLSGVSSGVAWGPLPVALSAVAAPSASIDPTSLPKVTSSNAQTYQLKLSPAPFEGVTVQGALAGTGWSFTGTNGPTSMPLTVGKDGVISPVIRAAAQAVTPATLKVSSLSGASWGPLNVGLSRS